MASVLTLKRDLNREISPVYVIAGTDGYLLDYAVKAVKDKTVVNPEWDLTVFDGGETAFTDVIADCNYPSMTGDRRTVVCYYPEIKTVGGEGDEFRNYLKNPNPDTVLILVLQKLPDNFGGLEKFCHIADCSPLDKNTIADKFIPLFRSEYGAEIGEQAASLLIESCSGNLGRIANEYAKLAAFKNYSGEITEEDIERTVVPSMDEKVFAIAENIACGKYPRAFEIADGLIKINNEKPYAVMAAVASQFRRMLHIALNPDKGDYELSKILGVKEFAVKKSRQLAAKYTQKKLKAVFDFCTEAEYNFKSGRTSELNALYQSLLTICGI